MTDQQQRDVLRRAVAHAFGMWDELRSLEDGELVAGEIATDDFLEALGDLGIILDPDDAALEMLRRHLSHKEPHYVDAATQTGMYDREG